MLISLLNIGYINITVPYKHIYTFWYTGRCPPQGYKNMAIKLSFSEAVKIDRRGMIRLNSQTCRIRVYQRS